VEESDNNHFGYFQSLVCNLDATGIALSLPQKKKKNPFFIFILATIGLYIYVYIYNDAIKFIKYYESVIYGFSLMFYWICFFFFFFFVKKGVIIGFH
jgi:hypothetical protein